MIYRFPSVSLPRGELVHQEDHTSVLRIAPLQGAGGIVVAFIHSDLRFRLPETRVPAERYDRTVVVATDKSLSYEASRVLLETQEYLLDAVPVHGVNKCMLLGRDYGARRYWLRTADRESGVTGPVYFLDNWAPSPPPNDPLIRRPTYGPPQYTPICCGGRFGDGNDFLVVARREQATGATGSDDQEYALVGLIVSADTLEIVEEHVLYREVAILGNATVNFSTETVKCWPVTNGANGTWDVGVHWGNGNVRIYTVSSTGISINQGVNVTPGWVLEDFKLAGGHVDLSHLPAYSRIFPAPVREGIIVLLEGRGAGDTRQRQITAVDYLDRTRRLTRTETGATFWLPTPVLLGPSDGSIRLAHDPGAGSHWGLLHHVSGSGLATGPLQFCRVGSSEAVFERVNLGGGILSTSGGMAGDCATAYDTFFDGMLVAKDHIGREGRVISLQRINRPNIMAAIPMTHHQDCPDIGQKCIRQAQLPPTIGCVPFVGQRWFEVHLSGAPPNIQVRLVISPDLTPDVGVDCYPRVVRTPGKAFSQTVLTDGEGHAVCTFRLDDIDMPEIFRSDTTAYADSGDILDYPGILFAQWSWTTLTVDLDVAIEGWWNDLVHMESGRTFRPAMPNSLTHLSKVMVLLFGL